MARPNERPSTAWAEAACLLAGALTPLAFHTLGTIGFEATKAVVVRLLALVLVLGWLAGRIGEFAAGAHDGEPSRALDLGGAAGRPFALVLVGLVVSLALSTSLSIQPLVSLLGSWDRVQGTATVLSWLVLGIAAALAGRDPAARRTLTTAWLVASLPVSLYALVQLAQLDPLAWLNRPLGATSTLGSSTALATYLAMLLPLSLARAVEAGRALTARPVDAACSDPGRHGRRVDRHRKQSVPFWNDGTAYALAFWAGLLVLQVAGLVAAQVRGGLLGAAAGLAVAGVVVLWRLRPAWRRPALTAAIVLTLGAGIVLIGGALGDGSVETDSTGQRLLIWRATLETIAAGGWRALLGFGPETQAVALEPRFPIELATRFEDLRFDRAHNFLLDTLLTTGLVGGVLLVALGGLVIRAGLRATASQDIGEGILAAGLLGSLAAYVAANSVAFDSNVTSVLGAMIAGLLVAPSLPVPARATALPRRRKTPADARPLVPIARLRVTGWLAAAAVGASLLPWLIAPLLADLYHTRALAMRAAEAPASSVIPEREAARWAPWQDVPLLAMALAYLDIARTTSDATGPV
ncbi:MAG: O-antigen ligase family protein, partial [Chloroflexota bacterium]|nr:O-antigen ligase family protein [Chloroflexota bacterium]